MAPAASHRIRVLVVDDHPVALAGIRLGLRRYPDIRVEWSASNGASAVRLAGEHQPDVAAIDVWLPDFDGFEVAAWIRDVSPQTRVIIISGDITPAIRARVSEFAIEGFFQKSEPLGRLAALIRATSPSEAGKGAAASPTKPSGKLESLSLEEHELLSHLARGDSLQRAAVGMGLSQKSADALRRQLMQTLGIRDRAELQHFAIEHQVAG